MGTFTYQAALLPGQRLNALAGISPGGTPTVFNQTLGPGFREPIDNVVDSAVPEECVFGLPVLTPCRSWSALVEEFFARFVFHGLPSPFAGAAARQAHSREAEAIRHALADRLGIRPEDADDRADRGFVLARIPRTIPNGTIHLPDAPTRSLWDSAVAQCRDVVEETRKRLGAAPAGGSLSPERIKAALDAVENHTGTHLVESLSIGDEAFQVFVYTRQNFERVRQAMDKTGWEGVHALSFRYFTSTSFLLYPATPKLASGDPAFAELRQQLADETYGVSESVFSLLLNDKAVRRSTTLRSLTCTGAQLRPLSGIPAAEPGQAGATVTALLDTVAVQGAVARFGAGCGAPAVSGDVSVPYAELYEPFTTTVPAPALWSPYVSVTQPYVDLGTFWNGTSIDRSAVRHLTVVADVIELREPVDLSSLDTVTLVCRLLIAGTRDGTVPTVRLSASAWEPLQLYCGSLSGTCAFEAANDPALRRVVFADEAVSLKPDEKQVAFDSVFGGRYPIEPLVDNAGTSPTAQTRWRGNTLETGVETLLLASAAALRPQAVLSPRLRRPAVELWKCLQWTSGYLRRVTDDLAAAGRTPPEHLASLYGFAATLSRSAPAPWTPVGQVLPQVPALRFPAFQDAVTRLLDVSDTYAAELGRSRQLLADYSLAREREFTEDKREALLRDMATFMAKQNEALAAKEKDLVDSHNAIINRNDEAALLLTQREGQLRGQYHTYLEKLTEARRAMSEAIDEERRNQETKLVFEFVGSMVEAFGGVLTGIYSFRVAGAAEGMEKTLKRWEAFLKFAETANKLIESGTKLAENIEHVAHLDHSTPSAFVEPPTDTDWDVFQNDTEAKVRPAEDFIKPEVARFVGAVRNLVTIAKSLNAVVRQKAQLQFDNVAEFAARGVSERQARRLHELTLNLHEPSKRPGHDYVADLGQLTATLQQAESRALNRLVEVAMLQDDSMTYHYLSRPSLISRFDLAEIKQNLAAQALSAVQALRTYPYPPTDLREPVEVTVEHVPVDDLFGAGAEIDVAAVQNDLFNSLARVRINSVDVRIDGVSTTKGQCHVQLVSEGEPMTDRGLRRETLTYRMISRDWHVVYDIASDRTIIGTEPAKDWGALFTKPTPFQRWRVLLPRTPENEGVSFDSVTTTVTLRFHVEAMYSAPDADRAAGAGASSLPEAGETAPDPSRFLSLLKGCSVTDGWDVVSFVSVDRINDLWRQRWKAETDAAFRGDKMFVQDLQIDHKQDLPGNIHVVYRLTAKVGPPSLTFVANAEQSAEVGIPLLEGTLTTITYQGDKVLGEDPKKIESTAAKPVMIKTRAQLLKLPGGVDEDHAVHIDPAQGVFALENIELDPQVDAGFCNELVEYFKKRKLQPWLLGTLRFHTDKPYLRPRSFSFRTYTPPPTHASDWPAVLGIHVLTSTTEAPPHGMRQSWPDAAWPVSTDFDAAVYFSATLLWENEVLPALPAAAGATAKLDPDTHQYHAAFTGKKVIWDQTVELGEGWESGTPRKVYPHATVTFDYAPLCLDIELTGLKLSYDHTWKESFPYQGRHPVVTPGDADVHLTVDHDDVTVSCAFDARSAPHIDKDTFNVTFDPITLSPTADIKYNEHKFLWFSLLAQLKPEVVANAKKALEDTFSGMKIELGDMSLFAVSNLLFPESRTLDPSGVYFPGDLVIVGDVTRQWKPVGG
ncbi:hypothetical protein [Saccharomonospora piscinae]|uniref:hypothetical protein n=1 Tax=Saccharomonospora piscinae TaxID=687388 RepID=UPI000465AED7|nr:hypothetical protein [Saccharomonospora piscinae]